MTDVPFLFDSGPVIAVQRFLGPGWPEVWRAISMLGIEWGILLAVGVALWLWGRGAVFALLAVMLVEGACKTALNHLVSIPRPDAAGIVKYERVDVPSFPSGHVSTATALWSWLALRDRVPWAVPIVVSILVGTGRIYLGVHYVGDVLGAMIVAALAVALVRTMWPPVREWLERRSFMFFAGAAALAIVSVAAAAFLYFGSDPYRWRAGGLVAGLAFGLPLEYRFVRYEPGEPPRLRKVLMVVVGGVGIVGPAAIDRVTGGGSGSLLMALTMLASIWAVLIAPALFVRLGWCRQEPGWR